MTRQIDSPTTHTQIQAPSTYRHDHSGGYCFVSTPNWGRERLHPQKNCQEDAKRDKNTDMRFRKAASETIQSREECSVGVAQTPHRVQDRDDQWGTTQAEARLCHAPQLLCREVGVSNGGGGTTDATHSWDGRVRQIMSSSMVAHLHYPRRAIRRHSVSSCASPSSPAETGHSTSAGACQIEKKLWCIVKCAGLFE